MRTKRLRILHVLDSLGNGGLEHGVVNLVTHMDSAAFEHCICTVREMGVNAGRIPTERVRLLHLGKREGSRFQFTGLRNVVREIKPDVVHSRNWGTIEAVLAARVAGSCATVHSEHGLETSVTGELWRRRGFRRFAFELADRVLCVSRHLRDIHARNTGFAAQRITVIHNGVDAARYFPDAEERRRFRGELGIGEREFTVGCVGNLLPVKNHAALLAAIEQLGSAARGWRVLLAGEGPERPKLEAAARRLSERGTRVLLLGTSARVRELLNVFDVYVLPSLNEGVSNSLLEAMATGLPVLAGDVGGTPEVVEDGVSGLLFASGCEAALAKQLFRLTEDEELRRQLGHEARKAVQNRFSIESMVHSYEQLYCSLSTTGNEKPEA